MRGRSDPRQARFLTTASLRWVVRKRAWTPTHLRAYWRFLLFRLRHPEVVTEGLVFLGRRVEVSVRPGYGRLILGRWVHLGDDTRLRVHEGTMRVGDKCVLGRDVTVNCYLDVELGAASLLADSVYICDFDHVFDDVTRPIKDQGIVKSPVRIGPDVWVGTKVVVLRGAVVGRGSVIAAHSVVRGTVPDWSVVVGVPGRVVRNRQQDALQVAAAREAADRGVAPRRPRSGAG